MDKKYCQIKADCLNFNPSQCLILNANFWSIEPEETILHCPNNYTKYSKYSKLKTLYVCVCVLPAFFSR